MTRLAAILVLLISPVVCGETTVRLNSSAAVTAGPVRLEQIAELTGDDAAALGAVEVTERARGRVTIDEVRAALDRAGVNWGRVALHGGECLLRHGAPRLEKLGSVREAASEEPVVVDLNAGPTVRTRIARVLADLYGVENEALRVRFDPRDAVFLDFAGGRFEVTVGTGSSSERVPVVVTVFDGDEISQTRTVRSDVRVRRRVLVLGRDLARNEAVNAAAVRTEQRWVSPAGSPVVSDVDDAAGMLARTRLSTGTVLREAQLTRPVLIKRNQLVTVLCLSGSVAVRVEARAMDDGKEGDLIEFRVDRKSTPFRARVSGAGVAVVTAEMGAS